MGIEKFYKLKAEDFNTMISRFKNEISNIKVYDANGVENFRRIRCEAKEWYDEVKFTSSMNNVDIGNCKNFSEVLKAQIDAAIEENKKEYADYIKSILKFLEFYYSCF